MQDSMFNTTDILVNVHPVVSDFFIEWSLVIFSVCIAQEVPRGIDKCVHCICLTTCWTTTFRTCSVQETFRCSQWRYGTRFEFNILWQAYWQLFFRNELFTAFFTIYYRNWHAPVTLTRNQPVTKAEVYFTFTNTAFIKSSCNIFTSLCRCLAVIIARVN